MKNFVLCFVMMSSLRTYAATGGGFDHGNGGDAVICYTDATRTSVQTVTFFDYWEQAQVQKFGAVDLGPSSLSVQQKIEIAKAKIAKFDPRLAEQIGKIATNIADNIQSYLVTSYTLPEIRDSNPQVIPSQPNCFIEQFAIQYKDVVTGQRRFYISDMFYNHASTTNEDRAGLLLHEAIYRYAILKQNANNSDGVRFFNYVAASKKIDSIPADQIEEYLTLLKTAGIYTEDCKRINKTYEKGNSTCYNQLLKFGSFQISIPADTSASRYGVNSFEHFRGSSFLMTINSLDGSQNHLSATDVYIDQDQWVRVARAQAAPGSSYPKMLGPLNKIYECRGFRMDAISGEMLTCLTQDSAFPGGGFAKTRVKDEWLLGDESGLPYIGKSVKLEVYGSKKGLKVTPSIRNGYSIPILQTRVNSQLQLLSGMVLDSPELEMPVRIGGNDHFMLSFEVIQRNGAAVLSFTSAPQYFADPKMRGLRLIDSSDSREASKFCDIHGLETGTILHQNSEYIGVSAEQFYDLGTDSIVYKTDEEVTVVDSILCDPKKFETDDY